MNSFRLPLILIFAASAVVLGAAWLFQLVGGLTPCELCLYERWPYYAALVLALLALAFPAPGIPRAGLALLGALFLASAGLGFYHVGIEQHWFPGPASCTSNGTAAESFEQFKAQILGQKVVLCDQIQWSVFGLSIAALNAIASAAIAAYAFWTQGKLK